MMMGMGFGISGFIIMLLFWVGIIVLAVWLVGQIFRQANPMHPTAGGHPDTPQVILDQRYARGELSREQYELMKQDLKQ